MNERTLASCKLKPCPFCGSPAEMLQGGPRQEYWPRCTNRTASFCIMGAAPQWGEVGFKFEKDAIKVWNRRPRRKT